MCLCIGYFFIIISSLIYTFMLYLNILMHDSISKKITVILLLHLY